jgi:hypothetical protein
VCSSDLLSLRTQIEINIPRCIENQWIFLVETELNNLFDNGADPLGVLKKDCTDIPMLTGLNELPNIGNLLLPEQNIWFEIIQ